MRNYLFRLILPLLTFVLLPACGEDDEPVPAPEPANPVSRTVLVYMVADNSLGSSWGCDDEDISEMLDGVKNGALNGGRLLVYHNRPKTASNPPQMLEITEHGLKVLKNYPDDPSIYSVDPERITEVIADMKSIAPADEYGLVLWSHASGWLSSGNSRSRVFGEDRGVSISIQTLAKTLADEYFEFIYFDCCSMGNIETVYEFRNITSTIVASPTNLGLDGMPYDKNIQSMFKPQPDMITAAKNTFDFYVYYLDKKVEEHINACGTGCQISVYDTNAVDAFATATSNIFTKLVSYPSSAQVSMMQVLSNVPMTVIPFSYDMDDYMILLSKDYPELLEQWKNCLSKLVVYHDETNESAEGIWIDHSCGLGTMVIDHPSDITWRGYNTLQWWHDVVSVAPAYSAQSIESKE